MTKTLTLEDIEYSVGLVNNHLLGDGRMVLTSTSERQRLTNCLLWALAPSESADENPQLERKAARLYYSIAKSQPLSDANKRLALFATAMLLADNGFLPTWCPREMHEIATRDDTKPGETSRILEDLALLISSNIQALTDDRPRVAA